MFIILIMMMENNNFKLDENLYEVARLDEKQLNNLQFDSDDDDLNDFLFNESLNYCKENLAIVYLVYQGDTVLGYFSLSADSIKLTTEEKDMHAIGKVPYASIAALKIGKLAVNKELSNATKRKG